MNCPNCSSNIPVDAKFCPECGTKITVTDECPSCGATLKPEARFCHNCGTAVEGPGSREEVNDIETPSSPSTRNWLGSWGPLLLIPVFVLVVMLLLMQNKNPEPPQQASNADQGAPNMAVMAQVRKTLQRLEGKLQDNPNDLVALDSLAQMYFIANRYDKAREYYERYLQIDPQEVDRKVPLAISYMNLNKPDEAKRLLNEVLQKQPTHPFGLYYMALLQFTTGQQKEALKNWKLLVQHYPDSDLAKLAQQRIHELEHTEENPSN